MYLFGSSLIKKYFPDFRTPNDIDWVVNDKSKLKPSTKEEEFYYIPFSPNREMTPDELYTLKFSHAIYDIKWLETMSDIRFLQIKGCSLIPNMLKDFRDYWKEVHGEQKRTNFDDSINFFNDNVDREIEHDNLHRLLNPDPNYKKILKYGVKPDFDLFFNLKEEDKKELLFEEAFVISLERYKNFPKKLSYNIAQKNLVTRLHPIWLSDFVIENWNKWYWIPNKSKFYENYLKLKYENRN